MRVKRQVLINALLVLTVLKMLVLPLYFLASLLTLSNVTYTFKNYATTDDEAADAESGQQQRRLLLRRAGNIRYATRRSARSRRNSLLVLGSGRDQLAGGGGAAAAAAAIGEDADSEANEVVVSARKAAANRVFAVNNLTPPFAGVDSSCGSEQRLQSLMQAACRRPPLVSCRLVRSAAGCAELADERRAVLNKLNSDDGK